MKTDKIWQNPVYFLAFGFGTGLLPKAKGTWGTLAAIPIYLVLAKYSTVVYLFITLCLLILGIWICERVSRELGEHDHPGIVWDEIVGYLLTMVAVPLNAYWILVGFILFRMFDILKPAPISYIDKHVKGGFGIMLDDVAAAVPAWIILQLLVWGFGR